MPRSGDPQLAKPSKTWTSANRPWSSPVQRNVAGLSTPMPSHVAQAAAGEGALVSNEQATRGDFNTANGGVWPRGYVRS